MNTCKCGCGGRPKNFYAEYVAGHRPKSDPVIRFWAKVDKTDACWLWTGASGSHGYGTFWDGERFTLAHRYSLTLAGVDLDPDLEVDHLCRVRLCVRPEHLEQVTRCENMRRVVPFLSRPPHCPAGHDYEESGFINRAGHRECRQCVSTRRRATYERQLVTSGAPVSVRSHCRRGHELSPENTHTDKLGRRTCATCLRASGRRRSARYAAKKRTQV